MVWIAHILLTALLSLGFSSGNDIAQETPHGGEYEMSVSGRVTSEDGVPLENIEVVLVDSTFSIDYYVHAITDVDGRYTVSETVFSTWRIRFEHPTEDYVTEYYDDTYEEQSSEVFTTSVGMVLTGVDAALAERGNKQITGQVTSAKDGEPLQDVAVNLYDTSGKWLKGPFITDSSGVYTVTELTSGSYKLHFDGAEAGMYYLAEYYNDKATLEEADAVVVTSGNVQDIDVSLEMGGVIAGNITSSWGNRPVDVVRIDLYAANSDNIVRQFTASTSVFAPNGYQIRNLPPGSYRLHFTDTKNHHHPEYYDDKATLDQAQPVDVDAEQVTTQINVQMTLTPTVVSIATTRGVNNTIFVAYAHDAAPHFTTNGGQSWQASPSTPWTHNPPWTDNDADPYKPTKYEGSEVGLTLGPNGETRLLYSDGIDVYVSSNFGQSWIRNDIGCDPIDFGTVHGILVEPTNPSNIYLYQECVHIESLGRYEYKWLWFSADAGNTWQDLLTSQEWPEASGTQLVPSPVVAGDMYVQGTEVWYHRSSSGQPWQQKHFPVLTIVPDAQEPAILYGWSESAAPSVIGTRSEDGGVTWKEWATQPCANPWRLLAHPTATKVLLVRCAQGLFGSEDGGDSWRQLTNTPGQRLSPDYGTSGRILWVRENGSIAGSTDNGATWRVLQPQVPLYLPSISAGEPDR